MKSLHKIPQKTIVHSTSVIAKKQVWENFDVNYENRSETDGETFQHFKFEKFEKDNEVIKPEKSPENINQIVKRAYNRGLVKGRKEGSLKSKNETYSQVEQYIKLFENMVEELKKEKETFFQENELFIVKLAIEVAKKIIQRELSQNQDILLYIVREALTRITDNGRIAFQMHPEDINLLKNNQDFKEKHLLVFEHVDFIASHNIQRGGCVIESESVIVDAQLEVQLERIEQSLLEGVNV